MWARATFVLGNLWNIVHRSRLFSNVDHFYFVARASKAAPAELKSIHTGCFLHILLSAIHFALHKQWIPSTWFIKSGRKCMSAKKELGKTNLFFLISKDLFTWYQESTFGNLFCLSRVDAVLNVSKQLFPISFVFSKSVITEPCLKRSKTGGSYHHSCPSIYPCCCSSTPGDMEGAIRDVKQRSQLQIIYANWLL